MAEKEEIGGMAWRNEERRKEGEEEELLVSLPSIYLEETNINYDEKRHKLTKFESDPVFLKVFPPPPPPPSDRGGIAALSA